jgi:hypothetical protein
MTSNLPFFADFFFPDDFLADPVPEPFDIIATTFFFFLAAAFLDGPYVFPAKHRIHYKIYSIKTTRAQYKP